MAIDLDGALGDTRPLWNAWLADVRRRAHLDAELPEDRTAAAAELDRVVGNWPALLERFAEEHAPVYLRPSAEASAALRRFQAAGYRVGAFTDAPEPLARVAASQLGAVRRLDVLEAGDGALARLLQTLGPGTLLVRTREELTAIE